MVNESWIKEDMVEILLFNESDFLKIKETLTRIGVVAEVDGLNGLEIDEVIKQLYQTCHILHKRGRYFISHYKAMLRLDGEDEDFTNKDKARLNTVASLLEKWDLLEIIDPDAIIAPRVSPSEITIIPFKEKNDWYLEPQYQFGNKG